MPDQGLLRAKCPYCEKQIGVRPDQIGRRLRCPACKRAFQFDAPPEQPKPPEPAAEPTKTDETDDNWTPAAEANELASTVPPPKQVWFKAKMTAKFRRSSTLVFQAAVQAVRNSRCDIVRVENQNSHLEFSVNLATGQRSEHDLFVFEGFDGGSELEISSRDPNVDGQYDPLYQAIVKEISKYLLFAAEPEQPVPKSLPSPEPEPLPPRYRRRGRSTDGQGLGIAGFVCGLVGLLTSCIPILGGILGVLGVVFGGIGMAQGRGKSNGFAVAALVLGIIATAFSFIFFLAYLDQPRRYRY